MGKTRNTGYLQNIVQYDGSNNIILPSLVGTGTRMVVAAANGTLSYQDIPTTINIGAVPTTRTITINGTSQDLSANRTWTLYTDDISEDGSPVNLWFTNARARAAISVSGSLSYDSATGVISYTTPSTTGITEGTNLYYTDARVGTYLTNNSYATQNYVSTAISNLVASAPATLDTLNELATALGNDPNFATTISTALGNRLRVDINTQGLTSTQKGYGRTNLGVVIGTDVQAWDADLDAIAALSGTSGFLVKSATNTWALDTNTYLTTSSASSTYVPYTGASANVNLGPRYLQSNYLVVDGQSSGTGINFKQYSSIGFNGDGYSAIGPVGISKMFFNFAQGSNNTKTFYFDVSGITTNTTRAYTMPNADGTIALTSDLSSYQPLDADLTAIAALSTTGFLKRTGANTWTLDTNTYLTAETDPYRVTTVAVTGTSTKTITLTRADSSTVTTTWTDYDTDTNTFASSLGFSGGTLTLTNNNATTVSVSLDGRYLQSYTETDTLASVTGRGASTSTAVTVSNRITANGTSYDAILLSGGGSGYNTNPIGVFNLNYPSADGTKYFAQYGGNWASPNNWGMGVRGANDKIIYISTASNGVIDVTDTGFNLQLGAYRVWHAGNLTNLNQLTNGPGYITSSATISGASGALSSRDNRVISPSEDNAAQLKFGFTSWNNNDAPDWADYLHLRSYSDNSGGGDNLIMFLKNGFGMRQWQQTYGSATAYSSYVDYLHSSNYSSYALPLSGGTMTGDITLSGANRGIYFTGGNNRIYFAGNRAIEGNGTNLQIGEGHSLTTIQSATLKIDGMIQLPGAGTNNRSEISVGTVPSWGVTGKTFMTDGVANYGVNNLGIILQCGYNDGGDVGGIKITDDGVIIWGAGDEDLFRIYNEDTNVLALVINDSNNMTLNGSLTVNSSVAGTQLNLPNSGKIVVNNETDTWGATFRTTASTTNLGGQLKNIIYCGGGSTEGFAVTGVGTGGAAFEVANNGNTYVKGTLTAQGMITGNLTGNVTGTAVSANRVVGYQRGSFTVGGNSSTFYPVAFQIGSGATGEQGISVLQIERGGYDDPGYTGIGFTTFHCRIRAKADGWGYGASYWHVEANAYTSPCLANVAQQNQTSQLIVWLRGATAYRWLDIEGGWSLNFSNPSGTSYSTFNGNAVYDPTSTNTIGPYSKWQSGWGNNYTSGTLTVGNGITTYGQIVAGYSSSASASYGNPLWIWANPDIDAIVIQNTTAGGTPPKIYFRDTNGTIQTSNTLIRLRTSNSDSLSAWLNGSTWNCSGDIVAYASDRRLKENITTISDAISKVKQLSGVTFDWSKKAEEVGFIPKKKVDEVGVIAQEVQAVLPQAIEYAPFDRNDNGTSRSGENYLTVKYEKIVPLLIEAIKEQQTQIEAQKSEIEELKELVKQLINK